MLFLKEKRQRIELKERERVSKQRQIEQLKEQLQQAESGIEDERAAVQALEKQVRYFLGICLKYVFVKQVAAARTDLDKYTVEYDSVCRELQDAQGDERESAMEVRKKALVDNLKRIFPDRVVCFSSFRAYTIVYTVWSSRGHLQPIASKVSVGRYKSVGQEYERYYCRHGRHRARMHSIHEGTTARTRIVFAAVLLGSSTNQ
jgi:hypothetical protein